MIKSAIALAAAAPLMAAPALAGPYVNVEANSGFTDQTTLERRQTPMWDMLAALALLTGTPRSVVPTSPLTVVMLRPFLLVKQVHPSPLRTL